MANLPETPDYPAGVYQLETSDPVLGGPGGIANRQAEQLGNRTAWLKEKIDAFIAGTVAVYKATRLATARTLSISGAGSGSASFDGSANANIALTLADSGAVAGAYPKVTVNTKGLVTGGAALLAGDIPNLDWGKINSGKPTTLAGYGITDAAPLASPYFTGDPRGPTPAQYDADSSLAPTAFVQRALGSYRAAINDISANKVLTSDEVGLSISLNGPSPFTVTLPAGATVGVGSAYHLNNIGAGTVTLAKAAGDVLITGNGGDEASLTIGPGDSATVVRVPGGGGWYVIGGSLSLRRSALFGASLSSNGHQKLPSGAILQWLSVTTSAGAATPFTWPVSFNALTRTVGVVHSSSPLFGCVHGVTNSGGNADAYNTAGARVVGNMQIFGIGY